MKRAEGRPRPSRSSIFTVVGLGLLVAACQSTPTPSASVGESVAPFIGSSYPEDAPADCAYGGEIAQIRAVDRLTVEFSLCHPDPAFLSKIALANNAIQDSDWLTRYAPDRSLHDRANGTGPYIVTDGLPGAADQITLSRYDGYWGEKAIAGEVRFEWSSSAADRLEELRSGTVDGIDNPAPDDLALIDADASLQLQPRETLSTMYVGMSNTFAPFDSARIRQALAWGIDRQRIVDRLFPPESELAEFFAPCSIQFACEGEPWHGYDLDAAREILANPGFPGALTTHIYYRDEADCGLPDPGLVAQELQSQLNDDLDISADIRRVDSATFLDKLAAGLLDGLYVMEWCAAFPDAAGFLGHHFNNPDNQQFGTIDPSISNALISGDRAADPTARGAAYAATNTAIRDLVPMIPIAHGRTATAWQADVDGAVASPLNAEPFAGMDPGGRPRLVWMQSASPGSFYCVDLSDAESVRLCSSVFEQLYGFKPGTAEVTPGLAESCAPNEELTVWTCRLRDGVTFHDGAELDANDVVLSYVVQWDYEHPLHVGRSGTFLGWPAEFGPFLNGPLPAR